MRQGSPSNTSGVGSLCVHRRVCQSGSDVRRSHWDADQCTPRESKLRLQAKKSQVGFSLSLFISQHLAPFFPFTVVPFLHYTGGGGDGGPSEALQLCYCVSMLLK